MSREEIKYYAPNLIYVCINGSRGKEYSGDIWHQYTDEPLVFTGVVELIRMMDHLYDTWDFPQQATLYRSFKERKGCKVTDRKRGVELRMETQGLEGKKGDIGSFIIRVKYRQNTTWQGEVIWVEKDERKYFRSALELLKLIDSALEEIDQKENPITLNDKWKEDRENYEREKK